MNRCIMLMFYSVIAGLMLLTSSTITFVESNEPDFTDCNYGAWLANRFISESECVNLYANGGMIWDLAQDFRAYPDQKNPNPDSNGNKEVWHFMYNPNNSVHNPLNYEYLNSYSNDGQKSEGWDDGVPEPSGTSIPFVRLILDNYILMHPDYNQIVIVRWCSPISGIVKIRGGFRHVGGGGEGVAWFVDKTKEGDGVVSLASGTIEVDFSADFGPNFSAEVNVGDFIDFIIDPRGISNYDGTILELTILGPVTGTTPSFELPPSPVNILGPEEIVFDWTTDRCETEDVPDTQARAFRDADGKVQLIASHFINRRMIGDDLASVKRDCNVIMTSDKDADPSKYNDMEWINAIYTLDGVNIHALVHNEYQGNIHPGMCLSGNYFDCWYNSITYAFSTDKGQTYTHAPAPQHRVANVPYKYVDGAGSYGIFEGSNIIRNHNDGYYYKLLRLQAYGVQDWGTGIMRTQTLEDPKSWRCWDGEGFDATFIDPYVEENYDPADHICEPVSSYNIGNMNSSLTYNTYFNKFLLVGATNLYDPDVGEFVYGFYYSLSDDLINWSPRQLIMKRKLSWTPSLPGDSYYGYPSLIDPDDDSMNFEYTDKKAYLYYTRWHIGTLWDRDLVRIPIEFTIKDSAFNALPTSGKAPLKVQFSDWSTGDITSWSWNFGDGSTSTEQNPIHTYTNSGTYTVSLSVWWPGGSDIKTKNNYIKVENISDDWETIQGSVTHNGTPLCAMVLANGQYMFSCGEQEGLNVGDYELFVPLDENGEITLFAFVDGLAPFKVTSEPSSLPSNIEMELASPDSKTPTVTYTVVESIDDPGWVDIAGSVYLKGTPLCAMVLANGQYMFSCDPDGEYQLSVPLDPNGEITLFVFVDGLQPYKEIISP